MLSLFRIGVIVVAVTLLYLARIFMLALGVVTYIYFLPGVIAMKRDYAGTDKVFVLCALTGWTVLGWLAALAFALALPGRAQACALPAH